MPTPWRFDGDSSGFVEGRGFETWTLNVRAMSVKDGAFVIYLIHPVGPPAPTILECRPVVFDVEGKRHLPVLERGGVCTDEDGRAVAMSRFRLDPGLLDLSALRNIGYERISPAAPARRRARGEGLGGGKRRGALLPGSAEGFAAAPGYSWLIAPSRVRQDGWGFAVSGAKGGVICDVVELRDGSLEVTLVHPGRRHADSVPEYRFVAFDEGRNRRLINNQAGSNGDYQIAKQGGMGWTSEHLCSHSMYVAAWRHAWPKDPGYPIAADVSYVGVERASPGALRDAEREFRAEFLEFNQALRAANEIQERRAPVHVLGLPEPRGSGGRRMAGALRAGPGCRDGERLTTQDGPGRRAALAPEFVSNFKFFMISRHVETPAAPRLRERPACDVRHYAA